MLNFFRALIFAEKFFKSVVPEMDLNGDDYKLLLDITTEIVLYNQSLENGKLKDGIKYILNISRHGNQYIQSQTPWVRIKGDEQER